MTTIVYAMGYEQRSVDVVNEADRSSVSIDATAIVPGGGYHVYVSSDNGYIKHAIPGSLTEAYFAVWVRPSATSYGSSNSGKLRLYVYFTDGSAAMLVLATNHIDVYTVTSGGTETLRATGSVSVNNAPFQVQVRIKTDLIDTKVDGISNGSYASSYGGGTIAALKFTVIGQVFSDGGGIDHLAVASDDWLGDVRIDGLMPTGDDTVTWTAEGGGSNYADVDDRPPNDDVDYVYTFTDAEQDLYTLEDYDDVDAEGVTRTPLGVVLWARARKVTAGSQQLKLQLKSGATTSDGSAQNLLADYGYLYRIDLVNPDTAGAWTDTTLDALKVGIKSVIP